MTGATEVKLFDGFQPARIFNRSAGLISSPGNRFDMPLAWAMAAFTSNAGILILNFFRQGFCLPADVAAEAMLPSWSREPIRQCLVGIRNFFHQARSGVQLVNFAVPT